MTRVFVTGMGALTPIGNDPVTFWENLVAGKSGAARITQFDVLDIPINIGCEVKDFDPMELRSKFHPDLNTPNVTATLRVDADEKYLNRSASGQEVTTLYGDHAEAAKVCKPHEFLSLVAPAAAAG